MAVNLVSVFSFFLLVSTQIRTSKGHGRLMDPPSRNALWRFGFPTPVDYNDNELFCGGWNTQWVINGGKCGVCGDAWNLPRPRPHEDGGYYGKGIIVRRYTAGQNIDVEVDLTANHMGTFQFKLCPYNGDSSKLTQECFDQHPLSLVMPNGNLTDELYITHKRSVKIKSAIYHLTVQLPAGLTCRRCVFQWTYTAGNGWGICPDGQGALGCGPQETFINCADVSITSNTGSGFGPSESISNSSASVSATASSISSQIGSAGNVSNEVVQEGGDSWNHNPYAVYYRDYTQEDTPIVPLVVKHQVCIGTGDYKEVPGMDQWCQTNCLRYPPSCPENMCKCLTDCEALPPFSKVGGSDKYCLDECMVYPSRCPTDKCKCR